MICPNCQKETPSTGNCCMHCGAVLNNSAQTIKTATPEASQPQKKKGGAGKIIAIIAIVIVVAAIVMNLIPSGPTGVTVYEMTEIDGTVMRSEYSYKNDIVYKLVESVSIALPEGTTDADIDLLKAQLELQFVAFDKYDICTVKYEEDDGFFSVIVTYNDLDNSENVKKLVEDDLLIMEDSGELISITQTEEYLLDEGYKIISSEKK